LERRRKFKREAGKEGKRGQIEEKDKMQEVKENKKIK
jgi:hypothetical protein